MTVYIEYAFLQNFLLDGILLFLALKGVRAHVHWWRLLFSACIGGIFAVIFPLLRLPALLRGVCKIAVGFLLPLLAFGRICGKKEWGRYGLSAFFFFLCTFGFGGALYGGMELFSLKTFPKVGVTLAFLPLAAIFFLFIEKLYKKRGIYRQIFPCTLCANGKKVRTQGFFDSGNVATKNGVPVCFLSTELFYELYGNIILFEKDGGQVCDEIKIVTLTGERRVPLYKGILQIKKGKDAQSKEVYFAPSANMIGREYRVIVGEII